MIGLTSQHNTTNEDVLLKVVGQCTLIFWCSLDLKDVDPSRRMYLQGKSCSLE